ncbi:MAG: serine/threonine-protein kinase [Candidatus Eiseniibacteriota bacterium]
MTWLSDDTVRHLRAALDWPELEDPRYEIREPIGRGGMGAVYRATDRQLDRDVAIKVLNDPRGNAGHPPLLHEARILARLEHPGIVPVHDFGRLGDGRAWYSMKLVRGSRLDEHVRGIDSLPERLRLFLRICEPVAFAHAHGVVHRDLKPANVMVGRFGEVLIMDWGVARVLGARDGEEPGTVLGTPGYMAPEQARGRSDLADAKSDIFALGAILGHLLDGAGPAPRAARAIRERAGADDPARRYESVDELARDVTRFIDGDPVSAYREGVLDRLGRWARRYRTAILLVLAYVVVRALVFLFAGT